MQPTDYITIQAPMVTELKLSGNALIIFALIHGFTRDGEHLFHGSLDYIGKWTNISKPSVISNLRQLVEKGYIEKIEKYENGVKFCYYRTNYESLIGSKESLQVVKKDVTGSKESLLGGSKESLPNINSIDNNINNNIYKARTFQKPTIEEIEAYIQEQGFQFDAEEFFDHYESNGWLIGGKSKMKDWKAAVRNWNRNRTKFGKRENSAKERPMTERERREQQTYNDLHVNDYWKEWEENKR